MPLPVHRPIQRTPCRAMVVRRFRSLFFALAGLVLALPAAAQTPLACGQVAAGAISAPGERDEFSFFGEEGDVVTFTLADNDPGVSVVGRVLRPNGGLLGTLNQAFQNVTRLPETGMYTAQVFDNLGGGVGNYAFRIGWLLPVSKQCGDRSALACGQTATGSIATPLEHDVFTFAGQQGQTVRLTLTQNPPFAQGLPFAQRVSPSGALLGVITTSFPVVMTLPDTGSYVVAVHDNINSELSAYSLRLESAEPCPTAPPPGPPSNLTASVDGATVMLNWSAPAAGGPLSSYVIEAGVAPGDASVTVFDTGSAVPSLTANGVPPGTYFVRVKARNAAGLSVASNEVTAVVGGSGTCTAPPSAPTGLAATVTGQIVTLTWNAAGGITSTYVIHAGSISGASNLVNAATGSTGTSLTAAAPPGTYFVHVTAQNACGISTASNEVVVTVP